MELILKPADKIKVIFDEKEYFLSKPTMRQARKLEEGLKNSPNQAMIELIVGCGLPEEVVMDLDLDLLAEVIEALIPTKKKA